MPILTLLGTNGIGQSGPDGVGFGVSDSYPAYTAAPTGPLAWYKASDLTGNDGDSVPYWPNAGRGGSAYDLYPAASKQPVLRIVGGVKSVEFTGSDWLQSRNDFPVDAFGARPRVLTAAFTVDRNAIRNICGYGQHAVTRAEFSLLQTNDNRVLVLLGGAAELQGAQSGGQVLSAVTSDPDPSNPDAPTAFVQVLLNGTASPGQRIQFDTQMQTLLLVGAGTDPNYNVSSTLRVQEVLFDAPATVAQAQAYHSQVRARTGY